MMVLPAPSPDVEESSRDRAGQKVTEQKKGHREGTPIAPGQRTCADENCGFGGPSIDPRRDPDKINRNDLADYWVSLKTLPDTVSTFCTMTGKAMSKTLFDYEIRMPSGGRCQRYFESSAASTEMRLITQQSNNGTVEVKSRSVAFSSRPGFHIGFPAADARGFGPALVGCQSSEGGQWIHVRELLVDIAILADPLVRAKCPRDWIRL